MDVSLILWAVLCDPTGWVLTTAGALIIRAFWKTEAA